ncbi:MAG: DUF4252 domain-containing protein [Dysgonamonadaceae bacterium]|nr:DUF4252 domain-containing protein [Dysgonamonadaceae bacterium]
MKKMVLSFIVLIALCTSSCTTSRSQSSNQQILSALEYSDDVTTFTVGSFGMFLAKLAGGFDKIPELKGIKSIQILFVKDDSSKKRKEEIKTQIARLSDDSEYVTLMSVKDKDDKVRMLVRQEDDVVKELLLAVVSDEDDDTAVIRIKGKMKLSDVKTLVEERKKITKKKIDGRRNIQTNISSTSH